MEDIIRRRRESFKELNDYIKLKSSKHKSYTYYTGLNKINKETISYTLPITQTPVFNGFDIIGIEVNQGKIIYKITKQELNNNEYRPRKDTERV